MKQSAYRCDDPQVLADFEDAIKMDQSWARRITRAAKKLGKNKGVLVNGFFKTTIRGLAPDDKSDPPEGWAYLKGWDCLRPKRGRAGAEARAWLEKFAPPPDPHGVLEKAGLAHFGRRSSGRNDFSEIISSPKVFIHDGTIWARYEGEPESKVKSPWKAAKLSEYFVALEEFEAENAPKRKRSA